MTTTKQLTPFAYLTLNPVPVPSRSETQTQANVRCLRAWRKGVINLTVTRGATDSIPLWPKDIDWDTMPVRDAIRDPERTHPMTKDYEHATTQVRFSYDKPCPSPKKPETTPDAKFPWRLISSTKNSQETFPSGRIEITVCWFWERRVTTVNPTT